MASASKTPWDLKNPKLQQLASLGQHALDSGAVAPEQAQMIAESMGVSTPAQSSDELPLQPEVAAMGATSPAAARDLAMTPPPTAKPSPLAMTAGSLYQSQGVSGIGNKKGAKAEAIRQDNTTSKRGTTTYTSMNPDQFRAEKMRAQGLYPKVIGKNPDGTEQYDFSQVETDDTDPVRQQAQGLAQMQKDYDARREYEASKSRFDATPIAALADALSKGKTHLAASMPAPDDAVGILSKAKTDLQGKQADLQKAVIEGVKAQKGGSTTDALMQAILAKDIAGQNNQITDRAGIANDRMDFQAHQNTIRALRNDKPLRDRLTQYQNLSNATAAILNADHKSTAQFDELQQTVRANMGIKGSSGVSERERTQLNSLDLALTRLKQISGGRIEDVPDDNELLQHVLNLAGVEMKNARSQYEQRLNTVAGGNASMYARRHEYASDLQKMLSSSKDQLTQVAPPDKKPIKTAADKAAESTAKPKSIDEFFGAH